MMELSDKIVFSCTVKWYDPKKGFGFLVSPDVETDILLHSNVLRAFGKGSVAQDVMMDVKVSLCDGGIQATSIERLYPNANDGVINLKEINSLSSTDLKMINLVPARVKWFDPLKGIGFAQVFGENLDVFLHVEVLRKAGVTHLDAGEAIALRVVDGDRGKFAVEIANWTKQL
jgi:cold shock protein